jgi:hypothetical protein
VRWGVGFGTSLRSAPSDGGNLAVNDCDAGLIFGFLGDAGDRGDAGDSGLPVTIPVGFDGSGWTGIQFWGKSLRGSTQQVIVIVDDDRSDPFGLPVDEGGCNSCLSGGIGACGDGFQFAVTFPATWTHIQVPFASMHPQGWSGVSDAAVPDVSEIFGLDFQISLLGSAVAPFEVAVAYIELYK